DPAVTNLVPTGIEIRRNHLVKPLAWRKDIMAAPGSPSLVLSATSGSLAAGTHYFRIVAVMDTDTVTAVSPGSAEKSIALTSGSKAVTVSWPAVPGADRYRVYEGTTAGGESAYLETASAATSFTYTGASEKAGTPPAIGTRWTVKNLLELKNAQQVTVDGNLI